jgi:CheY-like chemotaxis protein
MNESPVRDPRCAPAKAESILVVDDSRAMRRIVTRALRKAGFENAQFLEATNGQEALSLARTAHPNLVFTDLNMPGLDGLGLFGAIKAERLPCKVGFVTSEISERVRKLVADEGALCVVRKPCSAEDFRDVLQGRLPDLPLEPVSSSVACELFTSLTGQEVTAGAGLPVSFHNGGVTCLGLYHSIESDTFAAVVAFDASLASALASALEGSQLPPLTNGKEPSAEMLENLHEVLNVSAGLFGAPGTSRVTLKAMRFHPPPLSTELMATVVTPARRADMELKIGRFGSGRMSLFVR